MPGAEVAGGRLEYDDSGGEGPPVVLCPDRGADHTQLRAQQHELSDVYRVVTWAAERRSASPDGTDAATRELTVALFGLLDLLGMERVVVGGLGHGAAVSLSAALVHPDRVRALVLIDVPSGDIEGRDLLDRLEELAMPVLVLGADVAEPASTAHEIAARVSDCRGSVRVPADDGGTRDHAINDALRAFLESLPA